MFGGGNCTFCVSKVHGNSIFSQQSYFVFRYSIIILLFYCFPLDWHNDSVHGIILIPHANTHQHWTESPLAHHCEHQPLSHFYTGAYVYTQPENTSNNRVDQMQGKYNLHTTVLALLLTLAGLFDIRCGYSWGRGLPKLITKLDKLTKHQFIGISIVKFMIYTQLHTKCSLHMVAWARTRRSLSKYFSIDHEWTFDFHFFFFRRENSYYLQSGC